MRLFFNGIKLHNMKRLDVMGIGPGAKLLLEYDMEGGAVGQKRPRGRASDADSSISIMMDKPTATSLDIMAVQNALNLKEIDISDFVASMALEDLEDN